MKQFAAYCLTGFTSALIGYGVLLLPQLTHTSNSIQTLFGFTTLVGTLPVLIHALLLTALASKAPKTHKAPEVARG